MNELAHWHHEFAAVVACKRCSPTFSRNLLRDDDSNVPQPGYVGRNYRARRLLLIGQNPAIAGLSNRAEDRRYTTALGSLRDEPNDVGYQRVAGLLDSFIPKWPVHSDYFPLRECGLQLADIAYFNAVRCRTIGNSAPGKQMTENCVTSHLRRWLGLLEPRAVVFIGKWAFDRARHEVEGRGIPCGFMNRHRSLSIEERAANRNEVVALVRGSMGF